MNEKITFEDVVQNTSNGVIATDCNGHIQIFNKKARQLLNVTDQDLVGKDIEPIIPSVGRAVHDCLLGKKPVYGRQCPLGVSEIIVNITPIFRSEKLIGTVCNFQKLSAFETAAQKTDSYQNLNRQFETIFHSSSDGIWVCDGNGIVLSINSASEILNGIEADHVIGRSVFDLQMDMVFDHSVTSKVMASRQRETVMQYIAKSQKYLLSTGTPSIDEQGNIALIVINERDMTELNTLRRKFERSQMVREKYQQELSELTLFTLKKNSIIAESSNMRQLLQMALKLSHIGASNILVLGESGTGKGLLARMIHKNSSRGQKPFVEINCAALPENLLEAELFGYEKGAFTGARDKGKIGLVELAQGGTLFLDEIGDMPLLLQTKLLKYLDNQEIRRIGGTEFIKVSCSVIAATNQNLQENVQKKLFREDLYYRLSSFVLKLPPLRERVDDVSGLVRFYLNKFNKKYSYNKTISPQAIRRLQKYSFPGNIRELKSIIENGVVLSDSNLIDDFVVSSVTDEPPPGKNAVQHHLPDTDDLNLNRNLKTLEKQLLKQARKKFRTTREMAAKLGVSQPSVVRKLQKYNIS
ncbi:sigma 54-interacting transcriptional regulator [Desulforhopalus singaporensis]|uniref:HTH-type transcriptional regulatory protein TyrR n=1 Tax=Desulforhopalus singaporensis TaxID=91360 RepID=A0A1H0LW41_9BACT|nr:sigma 54-interacting transcriptional regulator [Desulforhopalus singaporensis]SDO72459.1 PAS domain S-box-containing protein/TyrR family helix-turn-helix domain-containing protein [Desulforhopalus singaporensis]